MSGVPPPDSFLHFLPPKEESLLLYLRCKVAQLHSEGMLTIIPALNFSPKKFITKVFFFPDESN